MEHMSQNQNLIEFQLDFFLVLYINIYIDYAEPDKT